MRAARATLPAVIVQNAEKVNGFSFQITVQKQVLKNTVLKYPRFEA